MRNHKILIYGSGGSVINRQLPDSPPQVHAGKSSRGTTLDRAGTSNEKNTVTVIFPVHSWYYHAEQALNTVDDCTHRWFREFLTHGTVWTGTCDNAAHRSQRLTVKPLMSKNWPRDPLGPSWPSFPSIVEWMEMCRKGLDPFARVELNQPTTQFGFTKVDAREVKENSFLATRIVANAIVGIRSSQEVPGKFHRYFRYRHGFLILAVTYCLPIGLVRFLLAQWIKCPYSLWLRRAVLFKTFLKKVPTSLVKRARVRRQLVDFESSSAGTGAYAHSEDDPYDSESYGSSDLD